MLCRATGGSTWGSQEAEEVKEIHGTEPSLHFLKGRNRQRG